MNRKTASRADILFEQCNLRQSAEQLHKIATEISSAIANVSPNLRQLVRKLSDEGKKKHADAIAKEFKAIVNHTQRLSKAGFSILAESQGKMLS